MSSLILPSHSDGVSLNHAELLAYKNHVNRYSPPALSIWSQLNGQHRSRRLGRGMDFSEVRPYQLGDDVRSIDWRVTARTGKAYTKVYTEEREQPVILVVDLSISMKFGSQLLLKSVQACHFAALLSWLTIDQKDRIGALIFNGISWYECKPKSRAQGALRIINALVKAHKEMLECQEPPNDSAFATSLTKLQRLCPKGCDITLISDFYSLTLEDKKALTELRRHNKIQCVRIFDPLEKGETDFRGHELVADKKQSLWLNFSSPKTRSCLEAAYQEHQAFVKNLTNALAIPLYSLSASKGLLFQLNHLSNQQLN